MIFDQLWRAERLTQKAQEKLKEEFGPLIEKAKKDKDVERHDSLRYDYFFQLGLLDKPESIATDRLVRRATKLGLPIPPRPQPEQEDEDEFWYYNTSTWGCYLTQKGKLHLSREIRREETERLEHRMRWIKGVFVPIVATLTGLIGTVIGLISLLRRNPH